MLGAALVQLGDDGAGALVHGAHDLVDDVDDPVAGLVVHGHDGAAVGRDLREAYTISLVNDTFGLTVVPKN